MAVHEHHLHSLLDFAAPPNAMPIMDAAAPAFDSDGLLAVHVDTTAPPPPWPQAAVSLSLFSYSTATRQGASSSMALPNQQLLQAPAAASCLQPFHLIRSSKYLGPVRELLSEFCSLEGDFHHAMADKQGAQPKACDVEAMSSGLWGSPSLSSMDLMELERRKARLMSMVQEVDRRYRRYREQLRSVELSFETVAGAGAAQVYTRLARRAMSRHFRCLRDALRTKAMGDDVQGSSAAAPGATKGDTPRLRVLDQCLRRQPVVRAVDNYPWRPQRGLPERAVAVLRAWLFEHFLHPYQNAVDKHILARQTGLSKSQVSNWFINARVRLWKPMIEDMYKEEVNPASTSSGSVKAERSTTTTTTAFPAQQGGESYQDFAGAINIATDGGDHNNHLFHSYPSLLTPHPHGSSNNSAVVSLTLGLEQHHPLHLAAAASSSSMMQVRSAGAGLNNMSWEGQDQEQQSLQLPYRRNLMLHDFDLAGTDI